ncbi:MAG: type II toxin-antitoxin system VapB family antitoxin [Bacteriovoracaceae bacterium]|nr:type II toxin-antitoxin system VapB family antitoxin [Bacteriovoracaceae bacterium]
MKRTNLVLDESNLKKATSLLGVKTYSEAVNLALKEIIALIHLRNLSHLMGQDIWSGNLSEMRDDKIMKKSTSRNIKKTKKKLKIS